MLFTVCGRPRKRAWWVSETSGLTSEYVRPNSIVNADEPLGTRDTRG